MPIFFAIALRAVDLPLPLPPYSIVIGSQSMLVNPFDDRSPQGYISDGTNCFGNKNRSSWSLVGNLKESRYNIVEFKVN
jgi:hypothetical protein